MLLRFGRETSAAITVAAKGKAKKRRGKRRHRETDSGGRVLPYRLSWAKWKGRKPSVDCASRHCVPDLKRLNRSTTLAIAPSIERRARPQQKKEKLGLDPPRHPDCSPRQVDGTTSRTKHSGPTPRLSTCDARRAPPSLTYPRFAPYPPLDEPCCERREHFPLSHRRETWRRGYGRRLQSRRHASAPLRRAEVTSSRPCAR